MALPFAEGQTQGNIGDADVIHDGLGHVFTADLRSLVDTGVWRSVDQGNTWAGTETAPCSDREWIAWAGPNAPTGPLRSTSPRIPGSASMGSCSSGGPWTMA